MLSSPVSERGCDCVRADTDLHLRGALVRHLQAAHFPTDSDKGHRLHGGHLGGREPGFYTQASYDGGKEGEEVTVGKMRKLKKLGERESWGEMSAEC